MRLPQSGWMSYAVMFRSFEGGLYSYLGKQNPAPIIMGAGQDKGFGLLSDDLKLLINHNWINSCY